MNKYDSKFGPVEILRDLDADRIATSDVVQWAERQLAGDGKLADESAILKLASISHVDASTSKVTSLLEELISAVVDFSITERELEKARQKVDLLLRNRKPLSINRLNCVEFVLGCCPEVSAKISEQRSFFAGHEPGLYNEMSAFSEHILIKFQQPNVELDRALKCLEMLFKYGDAEIRDVAAVGVLEGVINSCLNDDVNPAPLVERLLPDSLRAYEQLEEFWKTDHS